MSKLNLLTKFILLLIVLLTISFGAHLFVMSAKGLPLFENLIVRSYVVNGILAVIIYGLLYRFREKFKNQIGFLFMGGSFIKFIFFFLLFYPTYKSDGEMSSPEFAAFFVPYAIALFLETYFTSKMLKSLEESNKK
ncbi:hypothetical protein [Flagellimonas nanhaiensis]|uniref:DUF4293 family protein n=1 Tax=Flagellimonas nanhaiensis TaxID=2292706 RepID=A0A371JQU1_9FLAO|nr:hypothetical protein [Allomuricauda nanhaiensis]RDY59856.1 hypothetical protein DX873_10915 [Allomuricauda nanhaiensis]